MNSRSVAALILVISVFGIVNFLSCSSPISVQKTQILHTQNQPPQIEDIDWFTENIDRSYWTKAGSSVDITAFFNIWIYASDPDGIDDIALVVVESSYEYWVLRDKSDNIDLYNYEEGFFGGWIRCGDSDHPYEVFADYTIYVQDSQDSWATEEIRFSKPGSNDEYYGGYCSEEHQLTSRELLKRPLNPYGNRTPTEIYIQFLLDDEAVYNGQIWFYDASANFITSSDLFKNSINSGAGIYTDIGPYNKLTLHPSDLDLQSFSWEDIAGFHIVLFDGYQYRPTEDEFDHMSISKYLLF
jgi:hypothetical protein